jgi:hypothetical protein
LITTNLYAGQQLTYRPLKSEWREASEWRPTVTPTITPLPQRAYVIASVVVYAREALWQASYG